MLNSLDKLLHYIVSVLKVLGMVYSWSPEVKIVNCFQSYHQNKILYQHMHSITQLHLKYNNTL